MSANKQGNAEKTFKNFGKKVDGFMAEFNEATERLQKEFQLKFEELKESAEKLKKEAEDKERWKEVETNLKKAGDELGNAFKSAFGKKEKK
jgi:phosphoglycerate-specific signal transduction histidine kinase